MAALRTSENRHAPQPVAVVRPGRDSLRVPGALGLVLVRR